ncbi:MAG: hypothetical protein Ta2E_04710 [Mycoplasmoidaceae bacterium]|nr:MAG: hypothetical protein Ta2E_04710 [Mycoplasmoidaceae bacterium]
MSKVKVNIELEDSIYEDFKLKFKEAKKNFPNLPINTVEEFIAESINKMPAFDKKFDDIAKQFDVNILDILGKSGIDMSELSKIFTSNGSKDSDKNNDKKKEEKKID